MTRCFIGLVTLLLAACAGSDQPDAPVAQLVVDDGAGPISLGEVEVGDSGMARLTVRNLGPVATGALTVAIDGPTAPSFVLDRANSDCVDAALAAGATCAITVQFEPTDLGDATAVLRVSWAASTSGISLTLTGRGQLRLGFTVQPSKLDFGTIGGADTPVAALEFRNRERVEIAPPTYSVTGNYVVTSSTCSVRLPPRGSCELRVQAAPTQLGAATGVLTVRSGTKTLDVPLLAVVGGRIEIGLVGDGNGSIASDDGTLSCGTACSAVFTAPVTLRATPATGSDIELWSAPCAGSATTCAVAPTMATQRITATFLLAATRRLTLTVLGTGAGTVQVITPTATSVCTQSCVVPLRTGVEIRLKANTPSTWSGFAGACASSSTDCTFTPSGNAAVTAQFDKDPRERLTLLFPATPVLSVDYDTAGNLLVGTTVAVIKLAPSGLEIWRRPYAGEARVGADDHVFVRSNAGLVKLKSAGDVQWTTAVVTGSCDFRNLMARSWAAMPDGGIAFQGPASLVVYNSDGSQRFTSSPIGPNCRGALAVDADNKIYTGVENVNAESTDLRVYDGNGSFLELLENVISQYRFAIASSQRKIAMSSSGHSFINVKLLAQGGVSNRVDDPDFVENGVAIDDDGDVVSAYRHSEMSSFASGVVIRRHTPSFALRWSLTKTVDDNPITLETTGVTPVDLDMDDVSGDAAIGGTYVSPTFDGGWVEIFAEP